MNETEPNGPTLREVSLADKYDLGRTEVFLTGTQALVRLCLMQAARDRAAGLDTAGFVSGYRGSPLGGIDQQFGAARQVLDAARVRFQPGINEDLAATAVWGTQQVTIRGEGRVDGVFAAWYGKGPGVDRSGDVFRHGNLAGTHPHGGVLVLMGDDHSAESSTTAHQSEFALVDAMMPVLSPAGVQEILDYGLLGWAMSRFSGLWVGLKCVKDNVESTASVDGAVGRVGVVLPSDPALPPGGLAIRARDGILEQEERLHRFKIAAALAFIRANGINRAVLPGGAAPWLGIVASGKSYLDVLQALESLGIDAARAAGLGIALYKVGAPWPLEPEGVRAFARGLDLVLVVEEKRPLIESQLRDILFGTPGAPAVIGKRDESGAGLFASFGVLEPNDVAIAIGRRVLARHQDAVIAAAVAALEQAQARLAAAEDVAIRTPYFCAGCPHSTSTRLPDGARGYAGIGCHYMAQWMERGTEGYTHMGGEGANWVGEAPFSTRGHVFQNLGDGTYNHSGSMAIRFAVAAKVNITYKILFNDAVAMTGGQRHDGGLTVDAVARQVRAEGVQRIALVTDEPRKYPATVRFPRGVTIHHRDELDAVQRGLAGTPGVTVMIYDQTCASEKRRRRKRNEYPDPDRRVIINDLVCEGCGDCSVQSNCVAVQPVETEFGRKRRIDQSSCNKDFSCVKGFCPAFVTVHGARMKQRAPATAPADRITTDPLPHPVVPALVRSYNILVVGVGGTGVVTIAAILGMAAHLEGKGLGMIDMAGLAQKGGAVHSHVRLAGSQDDIHAIRIAAGAADLVLGCDLVVAGSRKVLASITQGRSTVVLNTTEVMPGEFTRNADFSLPTERIRRAVAARAGAEAVSFIDATAIATALLGNAIAANMFMLGFAFQIGRIPLSAQAIEKAIALNGEAVPLNLSAFNWGRRAAAEPELIARLMREASAPTPSRVLSGTLDQMIARRVSFLAAYQNAAYGERYRALIERVRRAEAGAVPDSTALTDAAARSLFRLMAYKDEYEVARLYSDGQFARQVAATFEGERLRYEFHLAPPLLTRQRAGRAPRKMRFGAWMMAAFRLLARFRGLRGTPFDPFGYSHERRTERRLIGDFERQLSAIVADLTPSNHAAAIELATLPQRIRGFGHVRMASLAAVETQQAEVMARFHRSGPAQPLAAA